MPVRKNFTVGKSKLKIIIAYLVLSVFLLSLAAAVFASSAPTFGNVAGGDSIDVKDVRLVMRKALEMETLTIDQMEKADVNNDGVIDVKDVVLVMRRAVAIIDVFPVEENLKDVEAIIFVNTEYNIVYGFFWPNNVDVTVATEGFKETVETDNKGEFTLDSGDLEIKSGQIVMATATIEGKKINKVHIVRPLQLISVIPAEGISSVQYVYGSASVGSDVRVLVFEKGVDEKSPLLSQNATADNDGEWIVDFSDEEEEVDIADAIIDARIYDLTNDATIAFWVEDEE